MAKATVLSPWVKFHNWIAGLPLSVLGVVQLYEIHPSATKNLARRYGIDQKTVAKWKRRTATADLPTGPKVARSTVLSVEEEAVIVAFRRHALLPLDDCLYALQASFRT